MNTMPGVNSLSVELNEAVVPDFCTHVGWPGVGLYALALILAAGHIYIAYEYTYYFRDMHVDGVWVFFSFTGVFFLLVLYHLAVWKKLTTQVKHRSVAPSTGSNTTSLSLLKWAAVAKASFDINGKHFLRKLYASELTESAMQAYNVATLYACTMPPIAVCVFCLLICLDHLHRLFFLWRPYTAAQRDKQVLTDMCADLLWMVLPLAFLWFGYRIPLTVGQMIAVVILPSLFTLSKLDELMEENVRRRASFEVGQVQRKMSFDLKRKRTSLFKKTDVEMGAEEQARTISVNMKWAMTVATAAAGLFFFVMGILNVAVIPQGCDALLWGSCLVKVPLCRLRLSCNCAVLHVKGHNMTSLPPSIESMTAMKKLRINHGPLRTLPELGNFMPVLAHVNLDFNRLETLPRSFATATNLMDLDAAFNEISSFPKGIVQHNGINSIDLSTNRLNRLPEISMKNLRYLFLQNNSLADLPKSLFGNKNIIMLSVDGNQLTMLPPNIGNLGRGLLIMGASRNNLTSFPASFRQLEKLEILDLRNNSLAQLPEWFGELTSLTHLTVSGNLLCSNGWSGPGLVGKLMAKEGEGCAIQCSDMCMDIYAVDQGCDYQCNVPNCLYDSGKCRLE